eukprot:c19768_g2_i2 orf=1-165(-)
MCVSVSVRGRSRAYLQNQRQKRREAMAMFAEEAQMPVPFYAWMTNELSQPCVSAF